MRRIRRTASSMRPIEMRPWASSCAPKSRMSVLVISESTPELRARAAASGPAAATPCPHGPVSGLLGGQARSSATAVQSLSMNPSKPHSPLRIRFIVSSLPQPGTPLMALNEHMAVPAPAPMGALIECGEVEVPQPLGGHVGGVVVAAALGLAVGDEVLGAGHQLVRGAVVAPLDGLDPRRPEHRVQVGVLPGGLGDPAPAGLVGDVDHGSVGLLEPDHGRLAGAVPVVVEGHP